MRFRPCIDIHEGKVKQIIGSTLNSRDGNLQTNFVADQPTAYFANLYKKNNLTGGHVIMLDNSEDTKKEAVSALKAFPDGLQIGGGITAANALEYLNSGASHIIVSSYIFTDGRFDREKLQKLSDTVGKKRLTLDLSCRKRGNEYVMVINKWQTFTDMAVNLENLTMLADYCDEFLIHGVDSEGKRQGVEKDLLNILREFTLIPITYAGGVKNFADIDLIRALGRGRIDFTVGSALDIFGGNLKYTDTVNYCVS